MAERTAERAPSPALKSSRLAEPPRLAAKLPPEATRLGAVLGNQATQALVTGRLLDEPGDADEEAANGSTRRPAERGKGRRALSAAGPLRAFLNTRSQPLDPKLRGPMESHFATRFDAVRIHTGPGADAVARSVAARAFTSGPDVVFAEGAYEPGSPEGRRLLAHELAHVVQQAERSGELPLIQRQKADQPTPAADPAEQPAVVVPGLALLDVKETSTGAEMTYGASGKIFIEIQSKEVPRAKAFAYNFFPRTLKREYEIIRIVAAPGVSVRPHGFKVTPSYKDPLVEIYKLQDPDLMPGKGEVISPGALKGKTQVEVDPASANKAMLKHHQVIIERQETGVDILNLDTKQALKIRAPVERGDAKFSYSVKLGGELALGRKEPTVVTVIKTPAVEVSMVGLVRGQLLDFQLAMYEVPAIGEVPTQGSVLKETGKRVSGVKSEVDETLEQTLATAAVDVSIGFIPVVGDLVDIAEFGYGLATGRDRWGRKLSTLDLALMGIGALLPIVSGALLKGGKAVIKGGVKAAAEAGKNLDQTTRIVNGLSSLADDELAQVRRWDELLRRGEKIPAGELDAAKAILAKIGRGTSGDVSASTGHALRDLVNEAGTGFRDPGLQEAYRRFLSEVDASGGKRLDPMEWMRTTQGRHRQLVEAYLGPQAAAIEFAENVTDYLAALRRETRAKDAMGRAWDYKRFPQLPDGVKWLPGDPIDMPNTVGKYPPFDTARKRHWMTRAKAEIDARAAGGARDAASMDPVARLDDATLRDMLAKGTAPVDPFQPVGPGGRPKKVELEHSGVPQRVVKGIEGLGPAFARDAGQLAGVSDPRFLFEVTPLEHAFFDYFAHTSNIPGRAPVVNPARADVTGRAWGLTAMGDIRPGRPLAYMTDDALLELIRRAREGNANFNQNANTRALRDAINGEIGLRGLAAAPFP